MCWTSSSYGPATTSGVPRHGTRAEHSLNLEDIEAVRQQISGIRLISAERFVPDGGTINYRGKNSNAQILGVPDEYFMVKEDVPFNFGRKLNPLDRAKFAKSSSSAPPLPSDCSPRAKTRSARMFASRTW